MEAQSNSTEPASAILEKTKERYRAEVVARCLEAISLYSRRKCIELQIEAMLKLSYFYMDNGMYADANDKLVESHFAGAQLSLLNRIQICNSIALAYKKMRFHRKFAFFLREAALLYKSNFNLSTAHCLLVIVSQHHYMDGINSNLEYHKR